MEVVYLVIFKKLTDFSRTALPCYIPTNNVWVTQPPCPDQNWCCHFLKFYSDRCIVMSHWGFKLVFLQWLMILNIFSCDYLPLYILLVKPFHVFCPFSNGIFFSNNPLALKVLHIFWMVIVVCIYSLQIFSSIIKQNLKTENNNELICLKKSKIWWYTLKALVLSVGFEFRLCHLLAVWLRAS